VIAAGGIRPIVRALRATYSSVLETNCHADTAFLILHLAQEGNAACRALASEGCIAPLIALLLSSAVRVQAHASCALGNLCCEAGTRALVVAAGGISPLFVLSGSPDKTVKKHASSALHNARLPSSAQRADDAARRVGAMDAAARAELSSALAQLEVQTTGERAAGIETLNRLSAHGGDFEAALASLGGIAPLVRMLVVRADTRVYAGAAELTRRLSGGSWAMCRALVAAGCVPNLVALLQSRIVVDAKIQRDAAAALCNLVDDDEDGAIATAIGAAGGGGIPPLIAQLGSASNELGAHAVAAALHRLSMSDANAAAIVSATGVPPLLALLRSRDAATQEDAAATIFYVCVVRAGAGAITAAYGVPALVEALKAPALAVRMHAVAVLRILVDAPGETPRAIAAAGGIPTLVELLASPAVDVLANALGTLMVMSSRESLCGAVAKTDAIRAATFLLRSSPLAGIRVMSARLLFVLAGAATERGVKGAKAAITASAETAGAGVAPLIELLKDEAPEVRAAGCRALRVLLSDSAARVALFGAGAQAALASCMSAIDDPAVRECVTAAFAALEREPAAK
jgi:hypothetical protein